MSEAELKTMISIYRAAMRSCFFKEDDYVKVLRKVTEEESKWSVAWFSGMDTIVGKTGKILSRSDYGYSVQFEGGAIWHLPYFVLEKVDKPIYMPKPFDRVLVRNHESRPWRPDIFLYKKGPYNCASDSWDYCIPYEGNEHLNGTTDTPEE